MSFLKFNIQSHTFRGYYQKQLIDKYIQYKRADINGGFFSKQNAINIRKGRKYLYLHLNNESRKFITIKEIIE
jgi:hypothetical protein